MSVSRDRTPRPVSVPVSVPVPRPVPTTRARAHVRTRPHKTNTGTDRSVPVQSIQNQLSNQAASRVPATPSRVTKKNESVIGYGMRL